MAAVICYILTLQWGGVTKAWNSGAMVGTLVSFIVLAIFFIFLQWFNGERAMVPFRLVKERTNYIGMIFAFCLGGNFFVLLHCLPVYLQVVAGIRNLAMIIVVTLGTIMSGAFISAIGHFVPLMISSGVISTIRASLIFTLNISHSSGN
jgi:hypothetical protein